MPVNFATANCMHLLAVTWNVPFYFALGMVSQAGCLMFEEKNTDYFLPII